MTKHAACIVLACTLASTLSAASAPVDLDLISWVVEHGGMVSCSASGSSRVTHQGQLRKDDSNNGTLWQSERADDL